jgi:hypothetical protein
MEITQTKFFAYEMVRQAGRTNMFDVQAVIRMAKRYEKVTLTRSEVLDIMKHYTQYRAQYIRD